MKKLFAILLAAMLLAGSLAVPSYGFNPFGGGEESSAASSMGESSSTASSQEGSSSESSTSSQGEGSSGESGSSQESASFGASQEGEEEEAAQTAPSASSGLSASVAGYPPDFADDLRTQGIYLLNLDSGMVVWERNSQQRMYPAALAKIVTAIVALEEVDDPDTETTDLKMYIQNYLYNIDGGPWGGILPGEELTIRDLLYAMMLQSANEATMMIADYVGDGSADEYFVELMNEKVQEIGAVNTHFANATGLHDEGNYTTPYDMALIAQYAMEVPGFMDLVTTRVHTSEPTNMHAEGITWVSNNMLATSGSDYYYEGVKGIIAGSLDAQNVRNCISTATKDGYTYLLVMMGAPLRNESGEYFGDPTTGEYRNLAWVESAQLYDYAFSSFRVKTLMNVGEEVSQVGVRLSWDQDSVKLLAQEKFATLVPTEVTVDDVQPQVIINNSVLEPVKGGKDGEVIECINAPVYKGDVVGYVKLTLQGEVVGEVPLVAAETVEQSMALTYLDKVKGFFDNFIFKFLLVFVIVLVVLYIALMIIRNRNRRRYQNRRRRPPTGRR